MNIAKIFLIIFLNTPISYLKNVGPQKAELLNSEINVFTYSDLIAYYPSKYIDKSKTVKIAEINDEIHYLIQGVIIDIKESLLKNGTKLSVYISDKSANIELVWFSFYKNLLKDLKIGDSYQIFGKANFYKNKFNFTHPEIKRLESIDKFNLLPFEPVYPLTEKLRSRYLDSKWFSSIIHQIISNPKFELEEYIPDSVKKPLKLINKTQAIQQIHFPINLKAQKAAEKRIKFDEMFSLAMRSEKSKAIRNSIFNGYKINKIGENFNLFYHSHLPFELTDAQKHVIKEIRMDMSKGYQMNRLLQGDVGSGKTIVAFLSMLFVIDVGYQSCLMAPTEILATQHYLTIKLWTDLLGIKIALLTGSTKKSNRIQILEDLKNGNIKILIGTHALIEEDVEFKHLALSVIDEQHRFGVAQRAKLWNKSYIKPHVLVMTATPIPRTLAMTLHGELDLSLIKELPKDRKPIRTIHKNEIHRAEVMEFLRIEVGKGRQAYIVYPLIEESNKLDLNDLMNGYDMVTQFFPVPKYQISILHGKLKQEEKDFEMKRFKDGITQIMIATTVIEVGVNVPNATVMIIENANRFGLSQLHQLRGRVGRGAEKSYCILLTKDELNFAAKKRIKTMCQTNNGFEIAQLDLELRGPGDLLGTRQSGLPDFKLLDLVNDDEIIDLAKRASAFIIKNDPNLESLENKKLLDYLKSQKNDELWSRVS